MKKMSFDDGVEHVFDSMRDAKSSQPFTALIGAGVSISADIPSGRKLIEEAHKRFPKLCTGIQKSDPHCYGKTMHALDPGQRRQLILPYIERAKLNWANIALAQLLAADYLRRVLTVNFDPLLSKASGLLGHYPAIYDFGSAPADNVANMAEPCIVHLHGQSTGFALLNTEEETKAHADRLRPLIQNVLNRAPLIVIGYSGQADALLGLITAHYANGHRLYWVDLSDDPSHAVGQFVEKHQYAHYIGGADADRFLVALCNKLNCFPPKIFNDPVGHLLDEMAPVSDYPKGTGDQSIDLLTGWREDMATLQTYHQMKFGVRREIERLEMEGKTAEAAASARRAASNNPSLSELADRLEYWALIEKANTAADLAKQKLADEKSRLLDEAAEACRLAVSKSKTPHEAFNNWGVAITDWAQLETDPAAQANRLREATDKFAQAAKFNPVSHLVYSNWGASLSRLARVETDPATRADRFKDAAEKFKRAVEINPDTHAAFFNWGGALANWGKLETDPAIQFNRFSEAAEKYARVVEIKPDLHEAFNNWGALLNIWASLETDSTKKDSLFDEAENVLQRGLQLDPNQTYNIACLASLRGRAKACHDYLKTALASDALPSRRHLEEDTDLDNVRGEPWFAEILALAKP